MFLWEQGASQHCEIISHAVDLEVFKSLVKRVIGSTAGTQWPAGRDQPEHESGEADMNWTIFSSLAMKNGFEPSITYGKIMLSWDKKYTKQSFVIEQYTKNTFNLMSPLIFIFLRKNKKEMLLDHILKVVM